MIECKIQITGGLCAIKQSSAFRFGMDTAMWLSSHINETFLVARLSSGISSTDESDWHCTLIMSNRGASVLIN